MQQAGSSWNEIKENLEEISGVDINNAYKTMSFRDLKCFYNTGKMDLGTNSEKATFDTFRKYVISIVK